MNFPYSKFYSLRAVFRRQAFRLRSGQALQLRSGQALQLRSGQALQLRSGQATLGFVFLVSSIIIGVSVSFLFVISSLINSGYAYQSAQQASLAAQSGIEDAFLLLARNKDFTSAGYPLTVGPATVSVSVTANTPVAGELSVVASATVGTNSRRAQAIATITPATGALNILSWSEITQ